jgi:hypothetical protein
MDEITKRDFEALKGSHEKLRKSYAELLGILLKLSETMQRFTETERGLKAYGEQGVAARLKVHYETFGKASLDISKLRDRI